MPARKPTSSLVRTSTLAGGLRKPAASGTTLRPKHRVASPAKATPTIVKKSATPKKKAAAKKPAAKKPAAKKPAAKSAAKKASPAKKKTPAKKASATKKKTPAKKPSPAKKSPAKKASSAKKAPAKKSSSKKATGSSHPTYSDLAVEAIAAIADRTGSGQNAIEKYILKKYPKMDYRRNHLRAALKRGAESGVFNQVKQSFKINKKKK
eukprot:CAMPEP_0114557916 /NCGR_PEP_ID=MMETSP0114-20121206/10091_1 /TAXON_ID=31324 /ORGANISM="Goniomonas sp, Strain m" /LENGTH=207 /DNA_ID=CAMNT_0001743247 /DNA_START=8 /DNA_END=631 /DNA_ORIENTATION=-